MIKSGFKIWSVWEWEHWRGGRKINGWKDGNIVTDEGLNYLLDEMFLSETQITTWHVAVFEDNYTPLITDTYVVPGYTECYTIYEATRPICQFSSASGKSISNVNNKASFTFSMAKDIYGGALVGGPFGEVIGDKLPTTGTILFCASKFTNGSENFLANDVAKVTVTLTAASG